MLHFLVNVICVALWVLTLIFHCLSHFELSQLRNCNLSDEFVRSVFVDVIAMLFANVAIKISLVGAHVCNAEWIPEGCLVNLLTV